MTLSVPPTPLLNLQPSPVPIIKLSAPVIPVGVSETRAMMVRESWLASEAHTPAHTAIEGTLMVFVNGLLQDGGLSQVQAEADDQITITYWTVQA